MQEKLSKNMENKENVQRVELLNWQKNDQAFNDFLNKKKKQHTKNGQVNNNNLFRWIAQKINRWIEQCWEILELLGFNNISIATSNSLPNAHVATANDNLGR